MEAELRASKERGFFGRQGSSDAAMASLTSPRPQQKLSQARRRDFVAKPWLFRRPSVVSATGRDLARSRQLVTPVGRGGRCDPLPAEEVVRDLRWAKSCAKSAACIEGEWDE
ncbi:SCPL39 [Symbiodinium sp. CCMP2592]|nr:SCPL39 [Symbiodinium sp. CCMP2592]